MGLSVPMALGATDRRARVVWVGLAVAVVAAAVGLAWWPLVTIGAVMGAVILVATVRWPLVMVGIMLTLGPSDLDFITGGFKGLFAGLGGLDMNGIRLVSITAGLVLLVLGDRRQWSRLTAPPVRWYLVFLAYAGLTLLHSQDPLGGLRLLFKLAWPLLFYLELSGPDRSLDDIDRLLDWVLVGAAVIIVTNPIWVLQGEVVTVGGEVRYQGFGTHQNPFSFYLLVVALIALARFVVRRRWRYLFVVLGSLVWIALTYTRITFVAGLVALAVVGLHAALVRRNWRVVLWGALVGALVVAVMARAFLVRTFGDVPGPAQIVSMVRNPVTLYTSINWSGRTLFWAALTAVWMQHPVFGVGLGSSSAILRALFTEQEGQVAHNEYIRLGTDTGFVGIGLFFVAMVAWLRTALAAGSLAVRRADEIALPALAVVIAWGVIAATDNAFDYYNAFTQYAGVLVAGCTLLLREREARP